MPQIAYPETRRVDVADEQFGVKVADPYRWLENDVRNDPEVAAWVAAENKVTGAYLDTLPGRDLFARRLRQLFDYERFSAPTRKGGRYFYLHNSGLQNQAVLFVRGHARGHGARADRSERLVRRRRDGARRMAALRGWQAPALFGAGRRHRLAHDPGA